MMRYRLLAAARTEYLQAVRWYRDEVGDRTLAGDFIDRFRQRLDRVCELPQASAPAVLAGTPFEIRRVTLDRFPYHIFFVVQDDELVVIAVSHHKRAPRYWARRLDGV